MHVKKRGQLSIFIAVGIMILIILALGIFMVSMSPKIKGKIFTEQNSLDVYMHECLTQSAYLGIYSLGLHTGNIASPTRHLIENSTGTNHELEHARRELIWFMNKSVGQCLSLFPNTAKLNITKKNPIIDVIFTNTKTIVKIDNMYNYNKANIMYNSQSMELELDVRYKLVHETVDLLIGERLKNSYILDSTALQTPGFDISVAQLNSTTELWAISDHMSKVYAGPFLYAYYVELVD